MEKNRRLKPAIYSGFNRELPFPLKISMIREAGFDTVALDGRMKEPFSYMTREGLLEIGRIIEMNSLFLDSLHAPFPECDNLFSLDENERLSSEKTCKYTIKAAAELGAGIVVVHLIPYGIEDEETERKMLSQGLRSLSALEEEAASCKVRLALENGQTEGYDRVLFECLSRFTSESVGFCYDSGHENVKGTCFQALDKYGGRLFTTHVHDNLGKDSHLLPGEGNINWENFRKKIHGLNYKGSLLLESSMNSSKYQEPEQFLAQARKRAENLISPLL